MNIKNNYLDFEPSFKFCSNELSNLKNKKILATGCSGLFGQWLIPFLMYADEKLKLNLKVIILTRNVAKTSSQLISPNDWDGISYIEGDIQLLKKPLCDFDYVIHGATTSAFETFNGVPSISKFNLLVDGTRRLLDLLSESSLKKFLFLSSGVVYGGIPGGKNNGFIESDLGAPLTTDINTALGHAKRSAEYIISDYAQKYDFDFVVARCFSFAGPGLPLDLHYAFGNFIYQAKFSKKVVIKSDGEDFRSFMYFGDLLAWIIKLLLGNSKKKIFNVGSDSPISIKNLCELIVNSVSPGKQIEILGHLDANIGNSQRKNYFPDISLAKKEYDLKIWTDLPTIVAKTYSSLE